MLFNVITTIAVTMAIFVLAAQTRNPGGESDGIAIPLMKRSATDARKFHATTHDAGMDSSERNTGTPHPSAVKRVRSAAGVDLTKYKDGIWYGTISIGTPPKSFTVQFNTGSGDLFVPASTGDENCRSHPNLWDPASSRFTNLDLNTDFVISFAGGRSVSGKQYWVNVTIAGFTADIQTIGAATTYSSTMRASEFAPDGVLGLAFPSLSTFRGQSPLFHTLYNEGELPQPVFSLKLTSSGGELYLGGMNNALYVYDTLVFTPVTNPVLWQLMIDNIQLNGVTMLRDVPAIIDTGANLIYGDATRVFALHHAFKGGASQDHGYYTFLCKTFPSLTLTINGQPFSIPADVLNRGRLMTGSRRCFSGIVSSTANTDEGFWSIGTIFLEHYYTVFDFNSEAPRIGFAELS